jgi:hypothetical protein
MTDVDRRFATAAADYLGDDARIDDIVSWQLTGQLYKKAPVAQRLPDPRCRNCGGDWHGLPFDGCSGSFDTPNDKY